LREQVGMDDDETSIHDLITDLGHYCALHDRDFLTITARAISCWCLEQSDPDGMNLGPGPDVHHSPNVER
jgi:hypothetical protein